MDSHDFDHYAGSKLPVTEISVFKGISSVPFRIPLMMICLAIPRKVCYQGQSPRILQYGACPAVPAEEIDSAI